MGPSPCPVCGDGGGFHDRSRHSRSRPLRTVNVLEVFGADEPAGEIEAAPARGHRGVTGWAEMDQKR